jgi:hypothetical protein
MSKHIFYAQCGRHQKNAGDLIGPYIFQKRRGLPPLTLPPSQPPDLTNEIVHVTVGSLLTTSFAKPNVVFWGTGIIDDTEKFENKAFQVCAVRGPLTRDCLLRQNIPCPPIYGDPALLMPRFYRPPSIGCGRNVGIIPHYVDFEMMRTQMQDMAEQHDAKIVDIEKSVEEVCDEICSCAYTISSSLHGIILSHAYGVPSAWMTTQTPLTGSGIKFLDYYASIGEDHPQAIPWQAVISSLASIDVHASQWCKQAPSLPDLDALLKACPF